MEKNITKFNPIKLNRLMSLLFHFFGRVTNIFDKIKTGEFPITVNYKNKNEKFTEAD